MAKQARYKELHNLKPGTSVAVNHQNWMNSRLITTELITSGGDTIANMKKEAKSPSDVVTGSMFQGDNFSSRIVKWDNSYSLRITEKRLHSHGRFNPYIYRMRPFTRSIDWYTDDPYEGVVEYDPIPVEDIDFSAVPHRREVLIWRLEIPTSFDVGHLSTQIDTINDIRGGIDWIFQLPPDPVTGVPGGQASAEQLSFEVDTVRVLAPIREYYRESDSKSDFRNLASFDIREDGWYRQLRKIDGSFVRVPEYPRRRIQFPRAG
jgi:hypothetical protein